MSDNNMLYDVIIAGLGPAGESAAIYTARKNLSTLVVAYDSGGQLTKTFEVENYLGIHHSTGFEMAMEFENHVRNYNVDIVLGQPVQRVDRQDGICIFEMPDGTVYRGRTALIATGAQPKTIGVPGETEFNGKGVTYCTTCDGPLYRNKTVTIIGGGTSGTEAALEMVKLASRVNLIVRSQLRGEPILMDRLREQDIHIYENHIPERITGSDFVEGIDIRHKHSGEITQLETDGVFIEIGREPNDAFLGDLLEINDNGEIVVNELNETNVEGIYAAGDVTSVKYKQIVIAAGEGAKAALRMSEYLARKGN